jgi:phage-related protein
MMQIQFYRRPNGQCPVEEYLESLTDKQTEKIFFVLELIETVPNIPVKFFKKLKGTDDIWEVRVRVGNDIFRLLGFREGNEYIILNHAFTKKTQKTPTREIEVAERRKKEHIGRRMVS